jgi:hypothetical protein
LQLIQNVAIDPIQVSQPTVLFQHTIPSFDKLLEQDPVNIQNTSNKY